jgi:hypothetical protein
MEMGSIRVGSLLLAGLLAVTSALAALPALAGQQQADADFAKRMFAGDVGKKYGATMPRTWRSIRCRKSAS